MVPPSAIAPDICANNSGEGLRPPRVAAKPPATPIIPKAFPRRAVPWVDRPARAPTQHKPEPRYIIFKIRKTPICIHEVQPNCIIVIKIFDYYTKGLIPPEHV